MFKEVIVAFYHVPPYEGTESPHNSNHELYIPHLLAMLQMGPLTTTEQAVPGQPNLSSGWIIHSFTHLLYLLGY